jgi:hypothetical protein
MKLAIIFNQNNKAPLYNNQVILNFWLEKDRNPWLGKVQCFQPVLIQ